MGKKKEQGPFFFDEYYFQMYTQRWDSLKDSLLSNSYSIGISHDKYPEYFLDAASIAAACCLPLDNALRILDLCAAPGGKTLVLSFLASEHAHIIANERSADRRTRLVKVIEQYIPENINNRITVTPYDGTVMYKKNKEAYDAILLDAPCSSERHVLSSPSHLEKWTKARIKNLSFTQWALLSSAYLMLKPGGYIVYSTCALSHQENDGVIYKLLKKYENSTVIDIETQVLFSKLKFITQKDISLFPEKTQYGIHILPDTSHGSGPLYISLVKKNEYAKKLDETTIISYNCSND